MPFTLTTICEMLNTYKNV